MSRTRIILLLLLVLCVAVGYAWIAMPKQRRVTPGQSAPYQTDRQRQKVSPASFPVIADLDFSGGEDNSYQKPQRNLFAPLYLPPKAMKPRPVAKVTKPVVRPQKVIPVIISPQGPKPIQPLNVLGYLSKAGEHTVFLASEQGDIYLVKTGDTCADNLIVNNISAQKITIGRKQTEQQVILLLGEAKSQRLPGVLLQSGRPQFKMLPAETAPSKSRASGAKEIDNKKIKMSPETSISRSWIDGATEISNKKGDK